MIYVPTSGAQVMGSARSLLRLTREIPERALQHPRYLALKGRLEKSPPRSILVVCLGNICRSPYMEAVLARALPGVPVASGGFILPGRRAPDEALAVAAARGYDLSDRRSQLVSREMVRDAELVVVMETTQAQRVTMEFRADPSRVIVAGDLDPLPFGTRKVRDPWQQPISAFESCFDRLDRCASTLVRTRLPG